MPLIVSLSILSGCQSDRHKWDDVPLVQDGIPYKIPPGIYMDVDGQRHEEIIEKWVISDNDLYDFIQYLKLGKKSEVTVNAVGEDRNPYMVSSGLYKDVDGRYHKEDGCRWVVQESDVENMPEFIEYLNLRKSCDK